MGSRAFGYPNFLGAYGTLIGAVGSWGIMPPMSQPDPGASA
jgi:hypothetical protein